ncbi:MarR family winged helix-turn-helix transcriptional regulator [Thalassotalea maritima]|uniref:MarR family winged helix-turn-helix transcriptional regulator n=1 Tax=Thalassotalea maritima TaxID=3242416 RepID=UPI003529238F
MFSQDNGSLSLQEFLPYRLSVLANRMSQSLATKYQRQFGISVGEWRIIAVLGEKLTASAVEITQIIAMDKVAVSRSVKKLIEKQLIKKTTCSSDSRKKLLEMTDDGHDLYQQLLPIARHHQQLALQNFSEQERQMLVTLISKLDQSDAVIGY